ncbi:MAG: Gldg family protein [Acetobacteraceae bacterium]|nr:Gldg family protein [Acetobacteraceae bacterium]
MRRGWATALGVLGALMLVIGVNLFADARLANIRLDLTQQRLYTLSNGTRAVIDGLKEPITLRLFYSRDLGSQVPLYGSYADRVREMLRLYATLSGGKIKLEFYDPEPFSDTEDRAMGYGLQGVPVDQSGEQVYFGLVGTNLLDDERTIAFFQPERERFLEYDVTKLVYELSNPKRPVVGVMSSLPVDGDPRAMMMAMRGMGGDGGRPWASIQQLRDSDTVKMVPTDAEVIPPDVTVLLVAQAQNLSDATLYAIDQFVMRGGRLMAMVDPYSEAQAMLSNGAGGANASSSLSKLFDAWGVAFDPTKVVADPTGAWHVRAGASDRTQVVDYLAWFNIRDGISPNDPATADLQQISVASSGFLEKKPDAKIDFTPLLKSSPESGIIHTDDVMMPDPARILAEFRPEGGSRVIAARVRGKLHSAFTGPPDTPKGQKRPDNFPPYKAETDKPANLVLAADTDILADRFWVRSQDFFGDQVATPFSDNGPFVANLVGTLAGGDALIGLRSRGPSIRPFEVVDAMRARAEAQFRQSERTLQQHLDEVEKKLRELRQGDSQTGESGAIVTPDQRAAIDAARQDILNTRARLRAVQLNLNRDISALRTTLLLLCVALVPALLAILAVVLGVTRSRRRARARNEALAGRVRV